MLKEILQNISIWVVLLPFVAGIINYQELNRDSRWIFCLVLAAIVPQILSFWLPQRSPAINISYNLYTLIEFFVLYRIFGDKIAAPAHQRIVKFSFPVFYAAFLIRYISLLPRHGFLNEMVCIANIFFMLWILILLKEQYTNERSLLHKKSPFTWYLLAILFYAPCTLFVFALYYYIRSDKDPLTKNLWIIQSVCNIIMYILFTVGLFIRHQKTRHLT